jgi:integrase
MASIVKLGKGKQPPRAIDFYDSTDDGKRKRVRIGIVTHDEALDFKRRIEKLLTAKVLNQSPDQETAVWLAGLSDSLFDRIAAQGLIEHRKGQSPADTKLGPFVDKYIEQRRNDVKPASLTKIQASVALLKAYFGESITIDQITPDAAQDWRMSLYKGDRKKTRAEATVRGHCRDIKKLFNDAVERELIERNPFAKLKSAAISSDNEHYVTPEDTQVALAACPTIQWKALFGLARLAGLRCPSETHTVAWNDVNWERSRLTVYAPKTDSTRLVPIVPELLKILEEAFQEAEGDLAAAAEAGVKIGDLPIVTLSENNRHRSLTAIVKQSGVLIWPDLYQTLRASCETEWASKFPQHAVSAWIGHSVDVSAKHYLRITDHLLDMASDKSATKSAAVKRGTGSQEVADGNLGKTDLNHEKSRKPHDCEDLRPIAISREVVGGGIEPPTHGFSVALTFSPIRCTLFALRFPSFVGRTIFPQSKRKTSTMEVPSWT